MEISYFYINMTLETQHCKPLRDHNNPTVVRLTLLKEQKYSEKEGRGRGKL